MTAKNVFISIDMEGIAGVSHRQQVARGSDDYPACRTLMANEANAAIEGAFAAGAERVLVNDSHGDMRNLRPHEIDERAELLIGGPKVPQGMTQGLDGGFDIALFLGYHASAGTEAAIMDHTYSGAAVYELRVNGESFGEGDLNAALAGAYGVPVGLVAGDDKFCAQMTKRLPGVRAIQVKEALGRWDSISLHPNRACELIREGTAEVVADCAAEPFRPEPPYVVEVDLINAGMADVCELDGNTTRTGPRTLRFETDDIREVVRQKTLWTVLAAVVLR
ncbi:MAG TPA: M55 family metallopeptidase [Acidimicrobiales bacterium]|nr:M55 family metallopeptidase [Acidimicrobiales bacterium]